MKRAKILVYFPANVECANCQKREPMSNHWTREKLVREGTTAYKVHLLQASILETWPHSLLPAPQELYQSSVLFWKMSYHPTLSPVKLRVVPLWGLTSLLSLIQVYEILVSFQIPAQHYPQTPSVTPCLLQFPLPSVLIQPSHCAVLNSHCRY